MIQHCLRAVYATPIHHTPLPPPPAASCHGSSFEIYKHTNIYYDVHNSTQTCIIQTPGLVLMKSFFQPLPARQMLMRVSKIFYVMVTPVTQMVMVMRQCSIHGDCELATNSSHFPTAGGFAKSGSIASSYDFLLAMKKVI